MSSCSQAIRRSPNSNFCAADGIRTATPSPPALQTASCTSGGRRRETSSTKYRFYSSFLLLFSFILFYSLFFAFLNNELEREKGKKRTSILFCHDYGYLSEKHFFLIFYKKKLYFHFYSIIVVAIVLFKYTHKHTQLPGHRGAVLESCFHPTHPLIASCSLDKTIYVGELYDLP